MFFLVDRPDAVASGAQVRAERFSLSRQVLITKERMGIPRWGYVGFVRLAVPHFQLKQTDGVKGRRAPKRLLKAKLV